MDSKFLGFLPFYLFTFCKTVVESCAESRQQKNVVLNIGYRLSAKGRTESSVKWKTNFFSFDASLIIVQTIDFDALVV
jgi:hypothetical protein